MTRMDLRISFKMDTGMNPLWTKNHDGRSIKSSYDTYTFIKGNPSSLYGRWLEEKLKKSSRELRDEYYRKSREEPTVYYFDKSGGRGQDGGPLRIDYSLWLEDKVLEKTNL